MFLFYSAKTRSKYVCAAKRRTNICREDEQSCIMQLPRAERNNTKTLTALEATNLLGRSSLNFSFWFDDYMVKIIKIVRKSLC